VQGPGFNACTKKSSYLLEIYAEVFMHEMMGSLEFPLK
jgi:hypothetical protein